MEGLKWVPDTFEQARQMYSTTSSISSKRRRIVAETTSLAFVSLPADKVDLSFVFFQDKDDSIRFGDIGPHQHWSSQGRAILFSRPIAQGIKNTPLATHIVPSGKFSRQVSWRNEMLFLFYVDTSSRLCQYVLDFAKLQWRPGNFPGNICHPADGSALDLEELESSLILSYTATSGYVRAMYNFYSRTWSILEQHQKPSVRPWFEGTEIQHAAPRLPGTFSEMCSLSPFRRQVSRFPPPSPESDLYAFARRRPDNSVILSTKMDREDTGSEGSCYFSDTGRSTSITQEENSCGYRIAAVKDFCAVLLPTHDEEIPGLVYVSDEGSMKLVTIESLHGPEDFTCRHRTLFEADYQEVWFESFLNRLLRSQSRGASSDGSEDELTDEYPPGPSFDDFR